MKRNFNYVIAIKENKGEEKEGDIVGIYGSKAAAENGLFHYGIVQENWMVLCWDEVLTKSGYLASPYRFKFKLYQ